MPSAPLHHPSPAHERLVGLIEQDRLDAAVAHAEKERQRFPEDAELARLHGVTLIRLQRFDEALQVLQVAHRLAPTSIEVLCNLGSVALALGQPAAALNALQAAQAVAPNHPGVLNGLGNARQASGDSAGARDAYAAATRAAPGYIGAWLNLAAAELELGRCTEAERVARMILTQVNHPQAQRLLGDALAAQRCHAEAEVAYLAASQLQPSDGGLFYLAGLMADEQGALVRATDHHARALWLDPQLDQALSELVYAKRRLVDHAGLEALSGRLRNRVAEGAAVAPFAFLSEPADAAEQGRCARQFSAVVERDQAALKQRLGFRHHVVPAEVPIRVGFVSNGFGNHPTGMLTVALIEALRDSPLQVQLFATAADDQGSISKRLRAATAEVHELAGLVSAEMARRIHASRCEVLIDLRGHGGGSVAPMLALRPAPVQINWLAYPGTSGAPWIDYAIADQVVLPHAIRAGHSEAIAWLPRCFQPCDTTRRVTLPASRTECGLPATGVVYCCFNNSYKFNAPSVARMLRVLDVVPDSVLWLLSGRDGSDERMRDLAAKACVDPQRLVFMAKQPHAEYLSRYRHVDLFLDTLYYNAHTTASDAIYAGCPVLTTPGDTFAGRVAASLNHHLGMDELNVASEDAFVEFAVSIGRDPAARAALRKRVTRLREASPLFDMAGFARDFATLITVIAQRSRNGDRPVDLGPLR
jgi:predicted O-linked N-acetylglucosamine transferase (SPINDLY family)